MKRPLPRLVCLVAAGFFVPAALAADAPEAIHGCPNASGEIVYQDGPCVDAPPAPPPGKRAAPVAAKPKRKPPATSAAKPSSASAMKSASRTAPPTPLAGPIRKLIDPTKFTSDPLWGSPERTLKTFIAAMKDGDRAMARSCLTAAALTDFGPRLDSMPAEMLRSSVAGYTGFVLEGVVGPFWSIRALRANARPKWIFFERVHDGTWKISAI